MRIEIFDKLLTNFTLRERLQARQAIPPFVELTEDEITQRLDRVTSLIGQLEQAGDNAPKELTEAANSLLASEGGQREEVQNWANEVLDVRYKHVSVSHQREINRNTVPIAIVNDANTREDLARHYGYNFKSFFTVLTEIGFWQRVGPLLEALPQDKGGLAAGTVNWQQFRMTMDHPNFPQLLTALNGYASIPYESAFPELDDWFTEIKQYKFHKDNQSIEQEKVTQISSLAVSDILTARTIAKLDEDLPSASQQVARQLHLAIVNTDVANSERYNTIYPTLKALYRNVPLNEQVAMSVEGVNHELKIPYEHEAHIAVNIYNLKREGVTVDATIVLHSFDDGRAARFALTVHELFPDAFSTPTGTHAPHYSKSEAAAAPEYDEADETIAAQLLYNYQFRYPNYPEFNRLALLMPLQQWDIMPSDRRSNDTRTTAQYTHDHLKALREVRGRPLNIVLVTSPQLSARAFAMFDDEVDRQTVATIKVLPLDDIYPLRDISEYRKITGLNVTFAESIKRLYDIATKKM